MVAKYQYFKFSSRPLNSVKYFFIHVFIKKKTNTHLKQTLRNKHFCVVFFVLTVRSILFIACLTHLKKITVFKTCDIGI